MDGVEEQVACCWIDSAGAAFAEKVSAVAEVAPLRSFVSVSRTPRACFV